MAQNKIAVEAWKDIVGYEGIYQVSDQGRVMRVGGGRGATPGRILKPGKNGGGYLLVCLCRGREQRSVLVHCLVAEAFLGAQPSPDHEVNHKNGDRTDNRARNLEWVTRSENHQHAYRVLGREPNRPKGEESGTSKLTCRDVKRIRRLYATGDYSQRRLGEMFETDHSNIGLIVRRESWQHVP